MRRIVSAKNKLRHIYIRRLHGEKHDESILADKFHFFSIAKQKYFN